MPAMQFTCPHCKQLLTLASAPATGSAIKCPRCGKTIQVPGKAGPPKSTSALKAGTPPVARTGVAAKQSAAVAPRKTAAKVSPAPRKSGGKGKMVLGCLALLFLLTLLLVGGGGAAGYYYYTQKPDDAKALLARWTGDNSLAKPKDDEPQRAKTPADSDSKTEPKGDKDKGKEDKEKDDKGKEDKGTKTNDGQASAKEQENLQGTWQAVAMQEDGNKVRADALERVDLKYVFKGNTLTTHRFGKAEGDATGTFEVDASPTPKRLDAKTAKGDVFLRAIYEIEGDTLKVCLTPTSLLGAKTPRPTKFVSEPGLPGTYLYVLKKQVSSENDPPPPDTPVKGGNILKHNYLVSAVLFTPDGKTLASAASDRVQLWDVKTAKERSRLEGHKDTITKLAISRDGKYLATASKDNTAKLWDLTTGKVWKTLEGHEKAVLGVAFTPDNKSLVTVSLDEAVTFWDVATGKRGASVTKAHEEGVNCIHVSPDGKLMATGGGDNMIQLWELPSLKKRSLAGHGASVEEVHFSPDGKTLASASQDKSVILWDVATGEERFTLSGHTAIVYAVAFTPDGRYLASASIDKTVKLWNVATGKEITTLTGHTEGLDTVAISPDGKILASGGLDEAVRLWDLAGYLK